MSFSSCLLNLQHSFYSPALWSLSTCTRKIYLSETSQNTTKTNKQTNTTLENDSRNTIPNQSVDKNIKKSSKVMIYKMYIICISHSQKTFVYLRSFMSSSRVCGFIDTHAFFLVRNDYSTFTACFKTILQLMFLIASRKLDN